MNPRDAARRGGVGHWLVGLALLWSLAAGAQVPVPPLTGHVVDQTATLSPDQAAALEQQLAAFEARKGSQVAVLLVRTTAPEDIEQFALRVAEAWKLGRKKVDDGAILVVAKDDRAVRIEVGYGLEGALTDLSSKRIISELILPRFRQQDFHGGVSAGVERMLSVIDGEPLPAAARQDVRGIGGLGEVAPVLLVAALAVGAVLRAVLGRLLGALVTGAVVAGIAWFVVGTVSIALIAGVIAAVATLLGIGAFGRGGGFYSGGGGRGGGGGGFSGGGGGFGGGGASGRW